MNFEGKTCGMCDKGALRAIKDEVEKGVYVDAYKCDVCGEIAYSGEVMKKIYALGRVDSERRKTVRVGNSLAVIIPAAITRKLKLKEKLDMDVREEKGKIIIRPTQA